MFFFVCFLSLPAVGQLWKCYLKMLQRSKSKHEVMHFSKYSQIWQWDYNSTIFCLTCCRMSHISTAVCSTAPSLMKKNNPGLFGSLNAKLLNVCVYFLQFPQQICYHINWLSANWVIYLFDITKTCMCTKPDSFHQTNTISYRLI